jgi:hypothetical protein
MGEAEAARPFATLGQDLVSARAARIELGEHIARTSSPPGARSH